MKRIEDIDVGQSATLEVAVTESLVRSFADYSGDQNPLHMDAGFAARTRFKRPVAHGLSYASLFSHLVGTRLPGPGALWTSQSFQFLKPANIGDTLTLSVRVTGRSSAAKSLNLDCLVTNQDDEVILTGAGEVTLVDVDDEATPLAADLPRRSLVIGGSRGIGAAIVSKLNAAGHSVAFTYLRSHNEAEELCHSSKDIFAISADASDVQDAPRVANEAARFLGAMPDTIVFSASRRVTSMPSLSASYDDYQQQLETSLGYPHALLTAVIPSMMNDERGCIIAVSSTHTISAPPPGLGPYVAAKAALAAFIKSVAIDYGRYGVRANIVAPSMTETSFLSDLSDRERSVARIKNPRRRLANPGDVSSAVSYLVSDDADFVNGETLVVSGGSVVV